MSEDRLITVAIYTYEKAQIIKGILENEGITVAIQNVNLIQPVVSSGVRIRIRENDLPLALKILENSPVFEDLLQNKTSENRENQILVPVDFSDYSIKACRTAFTVAGSLKAKVVLLHTYLIPDFMSMLSATSVFSIEAVNDNDMEMYKEIRRQAEQDMKKLLEALNKEVKLGRLPDVEVEPVWKDGIPEDEIYRYAKINRPLLIVMGTRGKGRKESDLIGSVTAEVFESACVPVLAIPENVPFVGFENVKSIAFFTNFDQQDLLAVDTFMRLFAAFRFSVHFVHIQSQKDVWDDVRLSGMKDYLEKHYAGYEVSCSLIKKEDDLLDELESFVEKEKVDLLAMTTRRRNVFARLFNPGLAHKMIFHSDTPLLVIPASGNV